MSVTSTKFRSAFTYLCSGATKRGNKPLRSDLSRILAVGTIVGQLGTPLVHVRKKEETYNLQVYTLSVCIHISFSRMHRVFLIIVYVCKYRHHRRDNYNFDLAS
jgi:hypothetical protein